MDEARIDIAAPAEVVYDLVANVTDMGRWSPETYRVEWVRPTDLTVLKAQALSRHGGGRVTLTASPEHATDIALRIVRR